MDTDDLSEEAYELIMIAARRSDTLKAEMGAMARRFDSEDDWLRGVKEHLDEILEDPEEYVDHWNLEEAEGVSVSDIRSLAVDLGRQVEQVLAIPMDHRVLPEW